MRGKVVGSFCVSILCRITPAYAGKSQPSAFAIAIVTDHPRLCGEKKPIRQSRRRSVGSPPPMRGKDDDRTKILRQVGITPAYAGKSR